MRMWLFLGMAIALEVAGSLALKASLVSPGFYLVVALAYIGSFLAMFAALRSGMHLGVGYGIWGASGVALAAIMSLLIFGETITLLMGIGIAIVMAGVLLVEIGSHAAAAKEVSK